MGVRSTAPFLELVIEECQRQYGATHQPDYPEMVVLSWPTPFWIDRPIDHDAMRARIAQGLRRLDRAGVDFMAMPANLPHLYFDSLKLETATPLLNLVEAAVEGLPSGLGPVAIVATRPIRAAGIYQSALAKLGVAALADDATQDTVDALLADLWAGRARAELSARWTRLLNTLGDQGANAVLVACTDFNAIAAEGTTLPPILDATRLMAERVVRTWVELSVGLGARS